MIFQLILAFLLPFLIGLAITHACFKAPGIGAGILRSSLAVGLGLGICSLLYFLVLPFTHSFRVVMAVELAFLISTTILFALFKNSAPSLLLAADHPDAPGAGIPTKPALLKITFFLFVFSLGNALLSFVSTALVKQNGDWDAWAIWNLKARFLYRSTNDWPKVFSGILNYSHPDYPLLLPGFISRTWLYLQHDSVYVPICVAGLFALAIVGLLTASVTMLRDKMQGCLAGLALLSTPFFIEHATAQYADVPLAFFFLSVIVLLTFAEQSNKRQKSIYVLAGIMSGLAAWTKNEGVLFVVVVVFSRVAMAIAGTGDWKMRGKPIGYFIAGLVPALLVLLYFKWHFAPINDLVAGQNFSTFQKLTSPGRYYLVIRGFILKGLDFGGWIGSPAIILTAHALVFGMHSGRGKSSAVANSSVIALTLLSYFFVYIVTPADLTWHMDTSLNRLLLQLYPNMLFNYFMIVASPTHILQPKKNEKWGGLVEQERIR